MRGNYYVARSCGAVLFSSLRSVAECEAILSFRRCFLQASGQAHTHNILLQPSFEAWVLWYLDLQPLSPRHLAGLACFRGLRQC